MRLAKIREQNAKQEVATPYNFCDRWCERCLDATKDRCTVYQKELDGRLQMIVEGRDPDDLKEILSTINSEFDETAKLVDDFAKQEGIEVWGEEEVNAFRNKIENEEDLIDEHPLMELANTYANAAANFVAEALDETVMTFEQSQHFETIIWYQSVLPSKTNRILSDLEQGLGLKPALDEQALFDAVAQIDVCIKAITCSEKALDELLKIKNDFAETIADLKDLLEEMKIIFNGILHQIDEE